MSKPYYKDDWLTVYHGDCRAVMAEMEPESVHCVVTSPPYWGLRDYGTATWVGGDAGCDHRSPTMREGRNEDRATLGGGVMATNAAQLLLAARTGCGKCGATRIDAQLGLEPTPEEYVANLVAVFREVRRVLRADGTVWLNLGDSYNQSGGGGTGRAGHNALVNATAKNVQGRAVEVVGLKPKDLVGIPWRVAFALQADGWYLRSDIIWSKPNPMPESVTDRPTKSHEYLFLLAKSARYYFDADAVREADNGLDAGNGFVRPQRISGGLAGGNPEPWTAGGGRNIRSVWTIATAPYPGAHFATFPPKLIEPCIKAGTSERGVCPECGAPWERVVERNGYPDPQLSEETQGRRKLGGQIATDTQRRKVLSGANHAAFKALNPDRDLGWRPSCGHEADPIPATVLDPFAGSGTTGMVAQSLSRRAVLIDLSLDYLGQLMGRNADIPLGLGA